MLGKACSPSRSAWLAIEMRTHRSLPELADDLWWPWNVQAREVFRRLDYPLWRQTAHNPVLMLRLISPEILVERARVCGADVRPGQSQTA